MKVSGKNAYKVFSFEAGGHRWQRTPPTEKRGRTQTSTITVSVLSEAQTRTVKLRSEDLEEQFVRGTGPGGQHRNKTSSAVHLKHIPTGVRVFVDDGRSQKAAREVARQLLTTKLQQHQDRTDTDRRNKTRKDQVGSGMRGDKIRTVQVQNDSVVDHRTGNRITYKNYKRGKFKGLR